jgi:hypothetical protein
MNESESSITNKPIFTTDDFIVNKSSDGTIQSGGYKVDNYFMSGGMPIMKTSNTKYKDNKLKENNNFSDLFKDLAIPAGLLYIKAPTSMFEPTISYERKGIDENDDVVEESLYDKLVKLAENTDENIKKQKKTRRGKINKVNKTKRRKN